MSELNGLKGFRCGGTRLILVIVTMWRMALESGESQDWGLVADRLDGIWMVYTGCSEEIELLIAVARIRAAA